MTAKGNGFNMQDGIRWVKTHCGRMDHGGCALVVGVKNDQIVKIKGDPLVLTSSKSRFYLHSSYRWLKRLRENRPHPKVEIHPETAQIYGIKQGDAVIIETGKGAITQIAHLTDAIHPMVINASYGWWFPEATPESQYDWKTSNFNMLTSMETLGKEFGTPDLKGFSCRIRRKQQTRFPSQESG